MKLLPFVGGLGAVGRVGLVDNFQDEFLLVVHDVVHLLFEVEEASDGTWVRWELLNSRFRLSRID